MAYLTIGFPKKYRLPEEDGPASILKLDQDEKYLLAVCGRNLVVWNGGRSRVILGIVSVCDDDVLAGADWSFVKGQIICVSRQGEVYIVKYSQVAGTSRLSTSDRGVDHQNPLHIASKNETARLDLKVERLASVFPDDNGTAVDFVTSLSACPAGLLIGTSRGILSCLSVDGDVIWRIKIPDFLQLSETVRKLGLLQRVASSDVATGEILHQDENQSFGGILKLDFNSKLEICGVVLGNGLAFLLSFPDGAVTPPELSQTRWLECVDVTSLALESRRMFVTVGLRNGDVNNMHIGYTPGDSCTLLKTVSLESWQADPDQTGPVSGLRWSRDGTALAIAWEKCGLAVLSISGCRILWISKEAQTQYSPRPTFKGDNAKRVWTPFSQEGKSIALEWGPRGFFLWSSVLTGRMKLSHCISEMALYRSGVLCNADQSESTRSALIGYDKVMILSYPDENGREPSDFQQLLIPLSYLRTTWPPEFISVNNERSLVAVAASKGVAVCNIATRRWRIFGDLNPGSHNKCCALAWIGKTLLIFNELIEASGQTKYELNVLSREANASPRAQPHVAIPAKPILVDVREDGYLLVICENSLLYLYRLEIDSRATQVSLHAKMILPTRESNASKDSSKIPGGGISVARIFPPVDMPELNGETEITGPSKLMMVRSTGTLIFVDMASMMSVPLLRNVEQFWYSNNCISKSVHFDSSKTRPVFWALGDDGVKVCFASEFRKLLQEHAQHPRSRSAEGFVEKWFEPDSEAYPIGVSLRSGTMIGISQKVEPDVVRGAGVIVPFCSIDVRGQPFFHRVLSHLLRTSDDKEALKFAYQCLDLPQFVDSLEWLLFEAVSDDVENGNGRGGETYEKREFRSRVLRLLHYFGEYEDIVIRCARKMESKKWPLLFAEVGEPAALLEMCYMSKQFRSAACLLIVLQEMWGLLSSLHHIARLLDRAIEEGCYDLASDLRHFLDNAEMAASNSPAPRRAGSYDYIVSASPMNRGHPSITASVIRKARLLLAADNFRSLSSLCLYLDFPLSLFLSKERGPMVSDFKLVGIQMHVSFIWDEPTGELVFSAINAASNSGDFDVLADLKSKSERQEDIIRDSIGSDVGVNFAMHMERARSSPGACRRIRNRAKLVTTAELQYLMNSALLAGEAADDIAALCAVLLLNLAVAETVMKRNSAVRDGILDFLQSSGSRSYGLLATYLNPLEAEEASKPGAS